jgi:hypothetical protein
VTDPPKDAASGNGAIGDRRYSRIEKWAKSASPELHAKDVPLSFKHTMKFANLHSGNHRAFIFENEMHVGMRQALGDMRRAAAKIPMDDPIMRDPQCKIGRRAAARMPHFSGGQSAPQHAARLLDFGVEELFDFRGWCMSRFYNHCVGRRAKVSSSIQQLRRSYGCDRNTDGAHEDFNGRGTGDSSAG